MKILKLSAINRLFGDGYNIAKEAVENRLFKLNH